MIFRFFHNPGYPILGTSLKRFQFCRVFRRSAPAQAEKLHVIGSQCTHRHGNPLVLPRSIEESTGAGAPRLPCVKGAVMAVPRKAMTEGLSEWASSDPLSPSVRTGAAPLGQQGEPFPSSGTAHTLENPGAQGTGVWSYFVPVHHLGDGHAVQVGTDDMLQLRPNRQRQAPVCPLALRRAFFQTGYGS